MDPPHTSKPLHHQEPETRTSSKLPPSSSSPPPTSRPLPVPPNILNVHYSGNIPHYSIQWYIVDKCTLKVFCCRMDMVLLLLPVVLLCLYEFGPRLFGARIAWVESNCDG